MAEIKSTLELVMERTRDLIVTADEKKSFHLDELTKKAKGWAQKYVDGLMNEDELKAVIKAEGHSTEVCRIIKKELLVFLRPDENNDKIYGALKNVLKVKSDLYQSEVSKYQKDIDGRKLKRSEQILKALMDRKIAGTSVVPNLNSDETWAHEMQQLQAIFHKNLMSFD